MIVKLRKKIRSIILPIETLMTFVPQDIKNILDIGAGTGFFLENITKTFAVNQAFGIEINKKYFVKRDKFVITNLDNIPNINFDILSFIDVLHHVKSKKEFISSYLNYVNINGYVIVKDMNPENFIYKWFNRLHDMIFAREFISEIKIQEVVSLFNEFGFSLEKQKTKRVFLYDHYFLLFKKIV